MAVFAPSFPPAFRAGGPARSLDALVANAPTHYAVKVITSNQDLGSSQWLDVAADRWVRRGAAQVRYVSIDKQNQLRHAARDLNSWQPWALYFNSFFNPRLSILPQLLCRFGYWRGAIRIMAPRGEFGSGAMGRRSLKKHIYLATYRLLGLHRGVLWHATSDHEVADIRRLWGDNADVVIREVDTLLPPVATSPERSGGAARLVFLGRLVEHKGLAIVLSALRYVEGPVILDIYGAEEDAGYVHVCRRLAESLSESGDVRVEFHGAVRPESVRATLAKYDVLLMPTAGENFGHVIAEALSVSCLVYTTPWTPWTEVLGAGGGVVVADREPLTWAAALTSLSTRTPDELHTARLHAEASFNAWSRKPSQPHLFQLVEERVERGPRPESNQSV